MYQILYWGIFPHFDVIRFPSDLVRDSSETCFYSRDYHIPHPFGYSFEIRFRESSLRYRLILHPNFLADYCWVGDSRLMMLDSSFWLCVRYPHWGIFPLFSEVSSCCWMIWLFLSMVIEMFDWFWQILYCTSDIHPGTYSPFHDEIMLGQQYIGRMIGVGYLPYDFDIRYYTGAYFLIFFEYPLD